jgi:apolipoprotein N-acyltransferase
MRFPAFTGWRWTLPGLVLGSGMALAFTPWLHRHAAALPGLMAMAMVVALVAVLSRAARPGQGGWLLWGFATAWFTGDTAWLYVSLHKFGGLPSWLAVLSIVLLSGALALYMATAGALWVRWRRGQWWGDAALFGALWCLAEVARALIFTGFPWASSGYAQVDTPLVALAPWLGVYGMGWVAATLSAALALAAVLRRGLVTACMLVLGVMLALQASQMGGAGQWARPVGAPLAVSLVQGNVPQNEKFEASFQIAAMGWHADAMLAQKSDLVMAPETVIPLLPEQLPDNFWPPLVRHFQQGQTAALFGVPLGSFKAGYTNSVVGISAGTVQQPGGFYRYNKHHLVPFGEFIPWGFRWFVDLMQMPLGDFTRGPANAPSFEVKGQWVAPNICYEDLFGEDLAARFTQGPTPPPTILANVSNLAWFGEDVIIFQHLQIARLRSLEFQRPSLRATNTGATVVIDHRGQVVAMQPPNTRGVLQATVQGTQGLTPFARWAGPMGLWPLIAGALALLLALVRRPVK